MNVDEGAGVRAKLPGGAIPAGADAMWYVSAPKTKWKSGICGHCGGSIAPLALRLRHKRIHGKVFHVICIAAASAADPVVDPTGIDAESFQKVRSEIIKTRRMVAETEATEPIHSVPLQLPGAAPLPINPVDNIVDVDAEAGDLHRLDPITFEGDFCCPTDQH